MSDSQENNFNLSSDEQLVKIAKSGIDEAYSQLIARYVFIIRMRASNYVNSDIDFEDLVQEGIIGLMNAVNNYDSNWGTSFSTFARLCIDRNIISAVRKQLGKRQIPKSALVFIDDNSDLADTLTHSPETQLIAKEGVEALNRKIDECLSAKEKNVLQMFLQGRSYENIASALQITVKSVDNAIQRIRRKLK